MQFLKSKIRAQDVLLETRKQATAVCLLSFCGKLILSFSFCLCVYSLAALPSYESLAKNLWLLAGVYALFFARHGFFRVFYAMTDFAQKRWFYKNAAFKRPVPVVFCARLPRARVFGCFTCFCFGGFSFSLHCWVILRRFYWARGFSITTCAASG